MNCYNHPDRPAVSFCRSCGRGLCTACQRSAEGTIFCPEHAPVTAQGGYGDPYGAYATGGSTTGGPGNGYTAGPPPFTAPAAPAATVHASPFLAFGLGFIPGVGAIYNGQYVKGLIHAGIFGLLITLISSNENGAAAPLFGILLSAFVFYMPFEAYHTAKRRQAGIPVEEWSSLSRGPLPVMGGRTPLGPIILIGIGVLFLLDTMNLIEFRQIGRFWPVILIVTGAFMLYSRMNPGRYSGPYPGQGPGVPPPGPRMAPNMGQHNPAPSTVATTSNGSDFVETGRE